MKFFLFYFLPRLALFFLATVILCGCESTMHLMPQDTWKRNIEMMEQHGEKKLILSGLCSHSAWGVDKLDVRKQKNELFICVLLKHQERGDFRFEVNVGNDIERIYWGDTLIWEKGRGFISIAE